MNLLDQMRSWLGIDPTPATPSPRGDAVREALEQGQRAKSAEDYEQALAALNRAGQFVQEKRDFTGMSVVALQKAEVFILQERWAEAGELLATVRQRAQVSNQKAQAAYALDMLGVMAQAQESWDSARQYYEQALNVARAVGATGAEGRALGHLGDTYLREGNASYASHLLREALPKLSATNDLQLSTHFVGLLGQAFIQMGQEVEGVQLLNRALRLAKQVNDQRYERYWSLVLGARSLDEGRYEDAHKYYEQALHLFQRARPTRVYITALCQMSKACLKLAANDEAMRYAEEAQRLSDGLDDGEIRAMVQGALGLALQAGGRGAQSIPYFEGAAEGYQTLKLGGDEIEILRHLGAVLADSGDDERAISTYRWAAQRAETLGARLELAETRRDLGLVYAQRNQWQPAIQEWTAALAIYEAQKAHAQIARLLCDIGNGRRQLGQGQRAMKDFEQALMALNMLRNDPDTRGVVLSNAANAYADQGDIESADAFFNEAIVLAQRTKNTTAEATRRGNYGWFLLATGRPRQAIAALEQALRLSESLKLDLQRAIQTDNLGVAYDLMGDFPKALEYHQRAREFVQPLRNRQWETSFQVNEANTRLELGQIDAAALLLEEALHQSRADGHIEGIVQALIGTGRVYLKRKQPQQAETALNEALALARSADLRRLVAEALSAHSQQQAAVNNPERSLALWEEARKVFGILQNPKANHLPAWLAEVSSS